jgi:LysM repeat protein
MFSNTPKSILILIFFSLITSFDSVSKNLPLDSLGIQKEGNKTFILHMVDPKETLFSLSRRYHVTTSQIEAENPELKQGLKVGQTLRIRYNQRTPASQTTQTPTAGRAKTHIVGQGQTLYSISRVYKISVEDIKKWNGLPSNEVNIGQEIYVSSPGSLNSTAPVKDQTDNAIVKEEPKNTPNFKYDSKGNKIHITENGQTLYTIANIYNLSVDEIKKLNSLSQDEISTGQEIIVEKGRTKEVTYSNRGLETSSTEVEKDGPIANTNIPQTINTKPDSQKLKSNSVKVNTSSNKPTDFTKVTERGLAEAIEETGNNPKFLALHRTATVGTIIQVKNELNNLYIFARVIGNLPETGTNDRVVVKLSKRAYEKLGAVDRRFPVEVSYVPQ